MIRTVLITGYDEAYAPLGELTVPYMEAWAALRGYEFNCYRRPLLNVPNGMYWTGVAGAKAMLSLDYDRVIYLDIDQFITNLDLDIPESWTSGFHASKDWGEDAVEPWQFSMCGFVAHKDCLAVLSEVLKMEPEWRDKPFPEQGPMQAAVKKRLDGLVMIRNAAPNAVNKGCAAINIHPRKVFNCVPDEVCPGKIPEPWKLGDVACHLTMLPLDERVRLFHEIEERVTLWKIGEYSKV